MSGHTNGARSLARRSLRRLLAVLALTAVALIAEVAGSLLTGSLALLADAGHMLIDLIGLTVAVLAVWIAQRPPSPRRTFGYYRLEVLAAAGNAVLLLLVSGYIFFEAYQRFQSPPEVQTVPMLLVAVAGLVVNLLGVALLHGATAESLNVRGAYYEVLGDALGSLGVVAAGLVMLLTGWWYADPLFSVGIGLFILPRAWSLLKTATDVLLETTPAHIDLRELEQALASVPGVRRVHDLHVWTITSGFEAMSGHAVLEDPREAGAVLERLQRVLRDQFSIKHATIQLERDLPTGPVPCEDESCVVPASREHESSLVGDD